MVGSSSFCGGDFRLPLGAMSAVQITAGSTQPSLICTRRELPMQPHRIESIGTA